MLDLSIWHPGLHFNCWNSLIVCCTRWPVGHLIWSDIDSKPITDEMLLKGFNNVAPKYIFNSLQSFMCSKIFHIHHQQVFNIHLHASRNLITICQIRCLLNNKGLKNGSLYPKPVLEVSDIVHFLHGQY